MFELGIGNDLGISCKWNGFGLKGQRSKINVRVRLNNIRGFELYECLLHVVVLINEQDDDDDDNEKNDR